MMKISLDKTIRAMSIALDLAEISSLENSEIIDTTSKINYSNHKFLHHSVRSTYIALELAKYLGLDQNMIKRIYIATLIHDIGAANSLTKSHTWDSFIESHCVNGASILKSFPLLKGIDTLSDIILYHHENWDGTGSLKRKGEYIPLESQIIRIADLVEVLFKEGTPAYLQKESINNWVTFNSSKLFSSKIANAFLHISQKDIFWFNMESIPYMTFILDGLYSPLNISLNLNEFESIANIFASIIDNKSKFTASHSRGIADLAYEVSKHMNYSEEKSTKMKIAGLLHDIGKLAIPSNILDKEGPLSEEEFLIIKSHVYYTKVILDRIEDIPEISEWASNHHEKLNGNGYPRSLASHEISEECKILGVCDIYQALTEDRPYRKGLPIERAFTLLQSMVQDGFICEKAVNSLKQTLGYK